MKATVREKSRDSPVNKGVFGMHHVTAITGNLTLLTPLISKSIAPTTTRIKYDICPQPHYHDPVNF